MPLATEADPSRVKAPGADERTRRDKPEMSPPAIRRRMTEVRGKSQAFFDEKSRDGRIIPDDELTVLDGFRDEYLALERMLDHAERWTIADESAERSHRPGQYMPYDDERNTHNGRLNYSMLAALRNVMDPRRYPLKGIELETHQEMDKRRREAGLAPASGTLIPMDLPVNAEMALRYAQRSGLNRTAIAEMASVRRQIAQQRALDTTAGAGSIPTIVDTTMIELLRPRMVTAGMGARIMTDMQGLFAIPRQTAASTFYMVTQGGSVTASNQTIDQVPFSPHTGGAYTTYTRQFLEQTNQDAEMFVREDQSAVVARGVETAALNGQGALGWPTGILQNPQVGVYAIGTNGGAPTWTQLISMASYVAYFNADVGSLSFVCDALTRGTLQLTLKVSGSTFPIYLWNTEAPEFPVAGYPCPVTNLLPQNISKGSASNLHAMIFANWQDLIYAFWSGLDVIVDPYTSASQGAVNIVALQDFDVNLRHYQSFASCVDIVSSITAPTT